MNTYTIFIAIIPIIAYLIYKTLQPQQAGRTILRRKPLTKNGVFRQLKNYGVGLLEDCGNDWYAFIQDDYPYMIYVGLLPLVSISLMYSITPDMNLDYLSDLAAEKSNELTGCRIHIYKKDNLISFESSTIATSEAEWRNAYPYLVELTSGIANHFFQDYYDSVNTKE